MADERPNEPGARLRELGAPPDVVAWADAHPSFDDAWEAGPSSRHRIWLGAAFGVAIERVAESAAAAFFAAAAGSSDDDVLVRAIEDCVVAQDAETAAGLAQRCEERGHATATYRERDRSRDAEAARAAAHVCRAFELLRAAELSMESARLVRATTMAGYMGGGVHAFLPAHPGPATLPGTAPASVERGLLLDAVTYASEAVAILAQLTPDPSAIDEVVWDTLAG